MRKNVIFAFKKFSSNKNIFISIISVFIITLFFPNSIFSEDQFRKITVVYPYNMATDWDMAFNQKFYNSIIIKRGTNTRISFLNIKYSLEDNINRRVNLVPQIDLIKEEYQPDLIVAMFSSVQNLFLDLEDDSLNQIDKIFVPVVPQMFEELNKIPNSFIIQSSSGYAIENNILSFKNLLPQRRHLIVVSGAGENDSPYLDMFKAKVKKLSMDEYYSIDYIVGQTEEDLINSIKELSSKNGILYFLPYNMDTEDNVYELSYLFPIIYENADMPVFSFFNDTIPLGAVGGIMTSPEAYGSFSAEVALKILSEGKIDNTEEQTAYVHQYNWLELNKWGIDEAKLPDDCEILYKQYTFFQEYKSRIIFVVILVFLETCLIVALSFNLVKRKRAEIELRKNEGFFERTEKIAKLAGWEIDNISKQLILTKEARHLLGAPVDKPVVIKSILKNIERSYLHEFIQAVHSVNKNNSIDCVIRYKTYSENYSWLRIAGGPVRINSRLTRMSGIIQNITVEKENELRLTKILNEKEILLKEVHHRVKNNLAIILSIIELQKAAFEEPVINEILQKTQGRVRTIALIFELLFLDNEVEEVNLKNFVDMLVNSIISENWDKGPGLKIELNVSEISMKLEMLFPIGLIINELVDNALRHGLYSVDIPELTVIADIIDKRENQLYIIIRDNGRGFKNIENESGKSKTVGLFLVETLVEQLDGIFKKITEENTVFEIRIPLK